MLIENLIVENDKTWDNLFFISSDNGSSLEIYVKILFF